MKRNFTKGIIIILSAMLFLSGCSTVQNNSVGNASKQISAEVLTKDDAKIILNELLPKAAEITMLPYNGIEYDSKRKITDEETGKIYYLVTDKRFKTVADIDSFIREVFSDNLYKKMFVGVLHGSNSFFKDIDGKLYLMASSNEISTLTWNLDDLEIGNQTENRTVVYADFLTGDAAQEGKIVLVRENEVWKLDINSALSTGIPYNSMYQDGVTQEYLLDRQEVVDYAKNPQNGAEVEDGEYVYEVEEDLQYQTDESGNQLNYYAVNLYKDGKIAYKLFVPIYGEGKILQPEKDGDRFIRFEYSKNVSQGKENDFFMYVASDELEEDSIDEYVANFENVRLDGAYLDFIPGNGKNVLIIIPKYYDTQMSLKLEDGTILGLTADMGIYISDSEKNKIIMKNGDKEIEIIPAFGEDADYDNGTEIDFKYPEKMEDKSN